MQPITLYYVAGVLPSKNIPICRGSTENGGPEFAGPIFQKMQDRKMQDRNTDDHFAGVENAGPDFEGPCLLDATQIQCRFWFHADTHAFARTVRTRCLPWAFCRTPIQIVMHLYQ